MPDDQTEDSKSDGRFAPHHPRGDVDRKELDRMTREIVPQLNAVANACLGQARWAHSVSDRARKVREAAADPHSAGKHDEDFARAIEGLASAREGVSKSEEKWRELARRADELGAEILETKRADVERSIAVDHGESEVDILYNSHNERMHPPRGNSKEKSGSGPTRST